MKIDLQHNLVFPEKGKQLIRKIDGYSTTEGAILGDWEIHGKVYNFTIDSYKEVAL